MFTFVLNVSSVETESKALNEDKSVVSKESGAGKAKENLNNELSKIVVETKTKTNTKAIQMKAMQNKGR